MRLGTGGGGGDLMSPLTTRSLSRFGMSLSKGRKHVSVQVVRMHWVEEREREKETGTH